MEYDMICIFTPQGSTFLFHDVKILCENERILQFSYKAMSDGRTKLAIFPKQQLSGWSVTPKS